MLFYLRMNDGLLGMSFLWWIRIFLIGMRSPVYLMFILCGRSLPRVGRVVRADLIVF